MNEFVNTPGCFACDQPILPMPMSAIPEGGDIALCAHHWNWWVLRWLNAADEPGCSAHLLVPEPSVSGSDS